MQTTSNCVTPTSPWLARGRSYRPFLITASAYLLLVQISVGVLSIPTALRGAADFRQLYTAGFMLRSGHAHELYDYKASGQFQNAQVSPTNATLPFNHLAYEAVLFAPLSFPGFQAAYITFLVINLALLALCFGMLRSWMKPLEAVWLGLPAVPFLCFYPVTIALIQGQDSILLLTLMVAALVSFEKGHQGQAGMWVALTAFKFQFTLPVLFLFLAWRWWRAALTGALTVAVLGCVSLYISGSSQFMGYMRSLVSMGSVVQSGPQRQIYAILPEAMPNLRGLLSLAVGSVDAHGLGQWSVIACSVLLLVLVACRPPSFPAALMAALLVSYHGLIHDATLLVIPLALLCAGSVDPSRLSLGVASIPGGAPPGLPSWVITLSIFVLVAPTLLFMSGGWFCLMALPVLGLLLVASLSSASMAPDAADSAAFGVQSVTKATLGQSSKCQQRGTLFTSGREPLAHRHSQSTNMPIINGLGVTNFAGQVALQVLTIFRSICR